MSKNNEGETAMNEQENKAEQYFKKSTTAEEAAKCLQIFEAVQYGTKHSLNVSVTTGIIVWEFANKLMKFR